MLSSGHMRRPTVGRGRQAGVTPNLLIAHLEKIAPTPVLLREPSPPLESVNNQLMLKQLKCSNILSQPLELLCGALVCTTCLQEWMAASGAENCPCCSEGGPLVSSHVRPAPGVILLLLLDVLVHCTDCSRDVKAGDYHHLHLRRRSKQQDCWRGPSLPVLTKTSFNFLQEEQLSECH